MKKPYEEPVAEKISFCYKEQVTAASTAGHTCTGTRGDNYALCRENIVWTD
ncbi:MAG: hypothetical protein Q4B70_14940 [Lachnospiraceae bacterium]|nr:hypothetical protein [Lachnospiraceae bacterium]